VRLSGDQIQRLDKVSAVPAGYPHELLASEGIRAMLTGNRWSQIDFPMGLCGNEFSQWLLFSPG